MTFSLPVLYLYAVLPNLYFLSKQFLLTIIQNDPVLTSPARLNEAIITPLGEILDSTSVKEAGIVPLSNNRFPVPRVTGNI